MNIPPVDMQKAAEVKRNWDKKVKPKDSLGVLEDIVARILSIRPDLTCQNMKPVLLLCAADHNIIEEGVSHSPQKVTWQQVENFARGKGAVSLMANDQQVTLKIIDCGVNHDFKPDSLVINRKAGLAAGNFLHTKAMDPVSASQAVENGKDLVRLMCCEGYDVIMLGEMGVGNTTSASAICSALLKVDPRMCTSKGAGLTPAALARKIDVIGQALAFHGFPEEPFSVLCTFGGYEIATMVGIILEAAARRRIIVIDGFVTAAALLVAFSMDERVLPYVIASHRSRESGHALILERVSLRPLLDLGLSLGEGTGALMSYPVIRQALHLYEKLETFDEAGVTNSVEKLIRECDDES